MLGSQAAYILQQALNALQLSAFYLPLAVAFALIQSITRRVFLSFGDLAMFGSFAAVYTCFGRMLQGDSDLTAALISLVVAMACAGALGFTAARGVFAPMIKGSALAFMIAAIGFSIALEELMRISTGSGDIWIPPLFAGMTTKLVTGAYPVNLNANSTFAIAISLVSVAGTALIIKYTQFGRSWAACSQDATLAMLCGVNSQAIIAGTFVLGAALSSVSGWMTAITYGGTNFSVGIMLGFKAMFAAVVGGFGNVRGAAMGAISLAVLEVLWSGSFGSAYRDVGVFSTIIVILLLKPEGLGGDATRRESEA
ncbi:branched-chain amino acid ABC transporter permease [Aestuariivirga litoralis]|uniref:branched-chain amino acid ABC transporter permease n=1 Tax=Aestuariivirga litoralis TaxID=2650924 RepID=UPI0018C7C421|nr:branched-chain amino acid ABC transporter permease [Aestuariivirga litoralis]MBG1233739.1 branched-chain amino acid ABC transporter permease [Aestuariivirga litoralis]